MANNFPIHKTRSYREFALFEASVTHVSPLDGDSGQSVIRISPESGTLWASEDSNPPGGAVPMVLHLLGTNEHELLADALRWMADELDRAPHKER